ncbi:MAG: hypothetical protein ACI837_002748 [Crocinitomicaceae bacterium]|jgi:hypothetical protein
MDEDELKLGLIDVINMASVELVMVVPETKEPEGYGSGCIVRYRDRTFLLSAAHVTDYEGLATCIVTHQAPEDGKSKLYSVGAMRYFDEYKVSRDIILEEIKSLDELLTNFNETIDLTFCELTESPDLIQPERDFEFNNVEVGKKIMINLDLAGDPDKEKLHGLCGNIRHEKVGKQVNSKVALKVDLSYHQTKGRFHKFLAPEIIHDPDDYRGCSGAPIIDQDGKLVSIAASVYTPSKIVIGMTIDECKRLFDIAIDTGMV